MPKGLKIALWVVTGLGAVALLVAVGISLMIRFSGKPWPTAVDGIRLEPARPMLRAEDVTESNGYCYLLQLTNAFVNVDDTPSLGDERDRFAALGLKGGPYPALDAAIEANAEGWKLLDRAAACADAQVVTVTSFMDEMPYISPAISLMRLMGYRIAKLAADGQWEKAAAVFDQGMKVAGQLSRGGPLINHLVTISGSTMLCRELRRLALEQEPPDDFLLACEAVIARTVATREPMAEAVRYERMAFRNAAAMVYHNPWAISQLAGESAEPSLAQRRGLSMSRIFLRIAGSTPENTVRHGDAVYSHLIASIEERDPAKARAIEAWIVPEDDAGRFSRRKVLLQGDPLGRVLLSLIMPALQSVIERSDRFDAELDGTRLVVALARYRAAHEGRVPASLEELVPGYLDTLPADPLAEDGAGWLYRPGDGWLLYSRGPDRADDGGTVNLLAVKRGPSPAKGDYVFSSAEFEEAAAQWRAEQAKKEPTTPAAPPPAPAPNQNAPQPGDPGAP